MKTKEYLNLPYTRIIHSVSDGNDFYYYGRIDELDGCQSTGKDLKELEESLNEAMELYIETLLEMGKEVPVPKKFSGKVLFRMPESLHRRLYYEAKEQGISLNQYGVAKLAR